MKRISALFLSVALVVCVSAVAFAHSTVMRGNDGTAGNDSTATKAESPAEEKKETPTQEKAEEKTEAKHKMQKVKMAPVDLNTASKEDLMRVPGISDELAEKIIAGRPYTSKGQLASKRILTKSEYKMVKSHVMAKKEKAPKM